MKQFKQCWAHSMCSINADCYCHPSSGTKPFPHCIVVTSVNVPGETVNCLRVGVTF